MRKLLALSAAAIIATAAAHASVVTQSTPILASSAGYDGAAQTIRLSLPFDATGDIHLIFSGTLSSGFDPTVYAFHEFIALDAGGSNPVFTRAFDGAHEQSVSFEADIPLVSEFSLLAWTQSDPDAAIPLSNDWTQIVGTLDAAIDPPGAVPEPASLLVLAVGLLGLASLARSRSRRDG